MSFSVNQTWSRRNNFAPSRAVSCVVKINWAWCGLVSAEENSPAMLLVSSGCSFESNSSIISRPPVSSAWIMGYASPKYFIVPSDSFSVNGKIIYFAAFPSALYCMWVITR